MKIIIVGGGITGIATALYAKELGFRNIHLFEKNNTIGGILKDFNINDRISFLRNCQYFDNQSPIFNVIDKNLFYEFKHCCGSFSNFNGNKIIRNDFAGPTFSSNQVEIMPNIDFEKDNVETYFNAYPEFISIELKKLFNRIANSQNIHNSCLWSLQLNRVFVENKVKQTLKLKSESIFHNNLYGLPRRFLGLKDSYSCLPIGGFDNLFSAIYSELLSKDIKVKLSTNINPTYENKKLHLNIKGEKINCSKDLIIWTADPNKFLLMDKKPLRYKPLNMLNYYFKINNFVDNPFYIQVYDFKSPIMRIFIYANSVVIEALKNNELEKNIIYQAKAILSKFFNNLWKEEDFPKEIFRKEEKRFTLFGPEIYFKLRDMIDNSSCKNNLIFTPWHLYGRDLRINDIFDKLRFFKEYY